jgi:quinol monooxygenase YgiN
MTRFLLAAVLGLFLMTTQTFAQEANQRLYVVTHVDIGGQQLAADAAKLLAQFATESKSDAGYVRMEILREPTRLNHFTMVSVWQNKAAFDAHLASAHTKAFREKLQPMLGSPFDERLHTLLP